MSASSRTLPWLVWGFLLLIVLVIGGSFIRSKMQPVATAAPALPVIGSLADFSLTNQLGQAISLTQWRGKVCVADIIFTRCPGPCATMTQRMSDLQTALPPNQPVQLVSLTTDPEFDTPAVLKTYGERFRAQSGRWHFLTGTKLQIAGLADSLKLTAIENKPEERKANDDLFVHSTIFVLVDLQGRLRGAFESLEPDFQPRILKAIDLLLREK